MMGHRAMPPAVPARQQHGRLVRIVAEKRQCARGTPAALRHYPRRRHDKASEAHEPRCANSNRRPIGCLRRQHAPCSGCATDRQERDAGTSRNPGPAARPAGRRVSRGRRHVGRRRQLVRGRAPGRGRLRGDRRHAAAVRPRRGARQEGRLLRRPGHPRCAPRRRAPRHSPLRARFRGAVSRRR